MANSMAVAQPAWGGAEAAIKAEQGLNIASTHPKPSVDGSSSTPSADSPMHDQQRSKRAIIPGSKEGQEGLSLDITKPEALTLEQRQAVVAAALQTPDQDAELLLDRMRERLGRVDMVLPKVEVRVEGLHIDTEVFAESGRNLPTILNSYRSILEYFFLKVGLFRPKKVKMTILNNISTILKPGRATLLLGPPAAGKSTLLKAMAGKLGHEGLKVSGRVTYNGHTFKDFLPQRTALFVEQEDHHMAELTVRETFDFSARLQGVGNQAAEYDELRRREKAHDIEPDWSVNAFMRAQTVPAQRHSVATEYVIRMLGLDICADTICGNQMMRGISGGQKKRVTTGEMVVGPKRVMFMDEISTGLDSSTTYAICKYLRDTTHSLQYTTLVALLQPAPETWDLFDDIMLLSEGYLVYHGPREEVMTFFEGLGFRCPERKGIADFLQEVTSKKDQQQYFAGPSHEWKYISVAGFAEHFKNFKTGREVLKELEVQPEVQPLPRKASNEDVLVRKPYALSAWQMMAACWEREIILVKRNSFLYIFRFFMLMLMALVVATMFLRTHVHPDSLAEANLYFSVVFFSLIMLMFDGFAEMTFTCLRLHGWYKQRDNNLYPGWAYIFPTTVLRAPYSLLAATLWAGIVYYPVNLAPEPGRFFTFILLLALVHSMGIGLFRTIGALARNEVVASTGGSFLFMLLLLQGGFLLAKQDMHPWTIWVFWANPIMYVQRAMAINEFAAPRWRNLIIDGTSVTDSILGSRGVPTAEVWIWIGVAVLVGFNIVFNITAWLAHAYLNPLEKPAVTLRASDDDEAEGAPVEGGSKRELEMAAVNGKDASNGLPVGATTGEPQPATSTSAPATREAGLTEVIPTREEIAALEHKAKGQQLSQREADILARHYSRRNSLERGEPPVPEAQPLQSAGVASQRPPPAASSSSRRSFGGSGSRKQITLSELMSQRTSQGGSGRLSGSQLNIPAGGKGMVLPFDPLALTFHHLNYYVALSNEASTDPEKLGPRAADVDGKKMLQLLCDCSGAFRPGILTALVGSSGAGKTTLMDVLAGRKTTGVITGDVHISGHPKVQQTFARVMGYVEQNDIHSPNITVHESLVFSARLRFTRDVPVETIHAFVAEIMALVELQPLADAIVGQPGISGLSVEQRKRLTIAVELVANPSIVFMDEPTSGLDARAAAIVMRTVRNTVNTGRTVVCTIHQPSIDIFEAFDDLLLLKSGGHVTYHGHLGKRSCKLIEYFEAIPGVPRLTEGLNPATWMLQISTPGMEAMIGVDFGKIYGDSSLYRRNCGLIEKLQVPAKDSKPLEFTHRFPQNYGTQFRMIFWKFWQSYWRNPAYNSTRFVFGAIMGLLMGACLWKVAHHKNDGQDLGNILGALYLAMLFLGIINSMTIQPVAAMERSVMYRERAAGMYDELPFALAQCTVELPYNLIQDLLFSACSYWMFGFFADAGKFFWYVFIIFCTLNLMTFYGIMGVYVTPDLSIASVLSSFFYGFWNLFTGFLITKNQMPGWWVWFYYINPLSWTLYGIIVTQLGQDGTVINVGATTAGSEGFIAVKDYLSESYDYQYSFIGQVVAILIAFIIFFAGLAICSLKFINYQRR